MCADSIATTAAGRDAVLRRLIPSLRRYLRRYCGDLERAEEMLQETLLRIDRALPGYDGRAQLETWALAIATHVAADHFRAASRQLRTVSWDDDEDLPPADERTLEERLVVDEMNACVREVIDGLPPDYRAALVLRDLEGHSTAETAAILGCSLATAKIRLHRARERLRTALDASCSFYHDDDSVLRCDRKR